MSRILIVEDDVSVLQLVVAILEGAGHEVISVSDGESAIEQATQKLPDLVITDMSLPVKTGWEVIAHLKNDAATDAIPIIALSAYDSQGDRDAGHEAGCDAYVGKPIDRVRLMKSVNKLLGAS